MGARPEEKAQAMMNKWVRMREEDDPTSKLSRNAARRAKRPFLASHCEHLADAEKFRRQIVGEIADGVKKIQNAGMGEHALRDLNDGINKLLREKWHWNRRIKELHGPDYNKEERKAMLQAEREGGTGPDGGEDPQLAAGLSLKGSGGYRYFGAAKDLPGVKELFQRQAAKTAKRKRGDIYKYITPDYYGLRDEEDGVLLELEGKRAAENQEQLRQRREEYGEFKKAATAGRAETGAAAAMVDSEESSEETGDFLVGFEGVAPKDAVPSKELLAQVVLQHKKDALMNKFS